MPHRKITDAPNRSNRLKTDKNKQVKLIFVIYPNTSKIIGANNQPKY